MMGLPEEPDQRSIRAMPTVILHDIFLRLPAKDVVRSSCVSKQWCSIVGDPSFRKLHDAHVAARSESEVLLVSENREPGRRDEASVYRLSSGKAMCHVDIPSGYSLTNVCNGFLCFALNHGQAPAVVCNPLAGETLELPKAPPIPGGDRIVGLEHLLVLGFSPPTREYKMFRLSFQHYIRSHKEIYIAVYTLGGSGGWRQYSYSSRFFPILGSPPVHIDGKLHVLTYGDDGSSREQIARILVLDVATETWCTYRVPYYYDHYHPHWEEVRANGFDLDGQMCLAVNILNPHRKLQFWVMTPPPPPGELEDEGDEDLYWNLVYSFDLAGSYYINHRRSAWLDHDQMLCYRHGKSLYKFATKGYSSSSSHDGCSLLSVDQQIQQLELPIGPSESTSTSSDWMTSIRLESYRWNICGGYRCSLLSPLIFASQPSKEEKQEIRQFEDTLLRALTQT